MSSLDNTTTANILAGTKQVLQLLDIGHESLVGRLLEVAPHADGKVAIHIASDQLSLADKTLIEEKITTHLRDQYPTNDFFINFKRLQTSPRPITNNPKTAFGLNSNRRAIVGVQKVIVVASGKGGVGKSTVSSNLAVALAKIGQRVGLLDADIYGPSAPIMFGLNKPLEISSDQKIIPQMAHGVKVLSFGFMSDALNPVMWRGPMVSKALHQLCFNADWGALDFLIIDLPPGTGDVQLTLIEQIPIHGALIVTTPQDVALIDANKALTMFEKLNVAVLGVVENMSHFSCPNCGHTEAIFGGRPEEGSEAAGAEGFAKTRSVRFLGQLPLLSEIRRHCDLGVPVATHSDPRISKPFLDLAQQLLDAQSPRLYD